eukprot:754591-Lingulodinium_polyedra.AAC.1
MSVFCSLPSILCSLAARRLATLRPSKWQTSSEESMRSAEQCTKPARLANHAAWGWEAGVW